MNCQKNLSTGTKAITTLLFAAAMFCCLCIVGATPVHASTDIGHRTTISNLSEGEYNMVGEEYYVDGDMAGEYEFNVPTGKSVKVYINGHSIDGGKDGEDLFRVGSGARLELIGADDPGESGTEHGENTVVHLWDYLLFKGWFYDYEEDKAITGPALINFEHAVRLEDGATLTAKELSFSGSKLSGIMIDGSNTTVNLENSAITYTSEKSSGGIFIDGDSNTVNLKNTLFWENRNYDSKKGGHIKVIGDGNKILGDSSATGDDRSCLKNGKTKNYGGAIYLDGDNCEIAHLLVKDNVSMHEGGAFYIDGNGAYIHDVEFDNNKAFWEFVKKREAENYELDESEAFGERGGAICLFGENGRIHNCMFKNNATLSEDTDEGGGAIYLDGSGHDIYQCMFEGNRLEVPCSYEDSSWIGYCGGAINVQSKNTSIRSSTIIGSYADLKGGAVFSDAVGTRIEDCTIENNEAYYEGSMGGGIYFGESNTVLKNSVIKNNKAGLGEGNDGVGGGLYYDGDNNIIEKTTIENNTSSDNYGRGVYVNNEDLTLDGKVIIRNNGNASGSQWSNLYLHKSTELSVVGGKLADGSEVWVDSKWGRADNPTDDGYIYHDSKATSLERFGFYSDRLGYSFEEKKGTLYYVEGAEYDDVELAAPTLSVEPKDEPWTESPGKVYINTDPLYTFSKEDKHYTVTKRVGDNTEELTFDNEGIKTDENGDYVELTGKAATYEFSLKNTLTIKLQDGSPKTLGTSETTTASYALNVPAEKCQVKVQRAYWGDMEPLFNDIGSFAPGARVEKKLSNQVLVAGQEPDEWKLEYHKKDTDDDVVTTIENFDVEYNMSTKDIAFTIPEDADGGTAKLTVAGKTESLDITYKATPDECKVLLPADPEDQSKHVIKLDYNSELQIKPIEGEVDGTTYHTEAILVDGENIGIDGKTINKVRNDLEIEYIFSTEIQTFDVTYDLEGTGLTEEDLYHKVSINETYNKGQSYLDKHEGNAGVNKKGEVGTSSLVVDHFQVGVDDGSGELTFSEDKTLGVDEPVTESMTLRMVLKPSFRGSVRTDRGAYLKAVGNNESYEYYFNTGDSIDVGIKEEYKTDADDKGKVVDYWMVTREHLANIGFPEVINQDEVRANGQAVSQNPGAEKEVYYKVSENSISIPLTEDMDYPGNPKKQVTVLAYPVYKDPVTDISGAPETMTVGESWNPADNTVVSPKSVNTTPVTWTVSSSTGKKAIDGGFKPTRPGKYTLEATAKDGLGLCKDYTQTFDVTVTGEAANYNVSFDVNGPEIDPPAAQQIEEAEKATKPEDPVWEDHYFDGWYVTEDGEEKLYDFNSPVVGDVALNAHWKQLYNITAAVVALEGEDGHGTVAVSGDIFNDKYIEGSEVILTATPDEDYKVKGWTDNDTPVEGEISEQYTISDLDADHEVTVEFEMTDEASEKEKEAANALVTKDSLVKAGVTYKIQGSSYKVLKKATKSAGTVAFVKAKKAKTITVPARVKLADGKYYNVTEIGMKAFAKTKTKTVVVKTKKLTKKSVKGSLEGSKVKTIKVKVGKKKINKKYVKKYKKIFTKKNAGRKVRVK